jgi:hypothetical protein
LKAVLPEYYVLLCAGRYAATVKKLALATTDDERQQLRKSLRYILESGILEADRERERRLLRYPADFRKALIEKDGSKISRAITSEEAEILRYASSIPPVEGWAQSDLRDSVDFAQFLGWADGFRSLAATVGPDYTPEAVPGAPVSLLKFMANQMRA